MLSRVRPSLAIVLLTCMTGVLSSCSPQYLADRKAEANLEDSLRHPALAWPIDNTLSCDQLKAKQDAHQEVLWNLSQMPYYKLPQRREPIPYLQGGVVGAVVGAIVGTALDEARVKSETDSETARMNREKSMLDTHGDIVTEIRQVRQEKDCPS